MSNNYMQRWVKVNNFETLMKLGVYPKEQIKAQRVIIDVTLEVNVNSHNDDTVSYTHLTLPTNREV